MLIFADHIWARGQLRHNMALRVEAGAIVAIEAQSGVPDLHCHMVAPQLTDLQVNGGGGVMLNSEPTPEAMARIAAAHRGLGTGTILPTVITDAPDILRRAAHAAIAAKGQPGIGGLHIEGPHINPARRGTHAERFIRPLDAQTMDLLADLRRAEVPVLLTLAPELAPPEYLAQAHAMGVVLSAGHSAANATEARAGLDHGISMFTHLFNAMPPMLSRDPGLVGAAILSEAHCGFIADGIHVSWEALRIAIAARPRKDRMFIVSDAMATVGGPEHFMLYGQRIEVRDGALVNAEGSLAGAHIDMRESLGKLHKEAGLPLDLILPMASDTPRAAMGLAPPPEPEIGARIKDILFLNQQFDLMEIAQ